MPICKLKCRLIYKCAESCTLLSTKEKMTTFPTDINSLSAEQRQRLSDVVVAMQECEFLFDHSQNNWNPALLDVINVSKRLHDTLKVFKVCIVVQQAAVARPPPSQPTSQPGFWPDNDEPEGLVPSSSQSECLKRV